MQYIVLQPLYSEWIHCIAYILKWIHCHCNIYGLKWIHCIAIQWIQLVAIQYIQNELLYCNHYILKWIHIATNILVAMKWIHQNILVAIQFNIFRNEFIVLQYTEMNSLYCRIYWKCNSLYCNHYIQNEFIVLQYNDILSEYIVLQPMIFKNNSIQCIAEYIGCNEQWIATNIFWNEFISEYIAIQWIAFQYILEWIHCIQEYILKCNTMNCNHFRIYWLQYNEFMKWIHCIASNIFEYIGIAIQWIHFRILLYCNQYIQWIHCIATNIFCCNTLYCNHYIQNEFIVLQCNEFISEYIGCNIFWNEFIVLQPIYCLQYIVLNSIYSEMNYCIAIQYILIMNWIVFASNIFWNAIQWIATEYIGSIQWIHWIYCNQYNEFILQEYIWLQYNEFNIFRMNSLYCNQYILNNWLNTMNCIATNISGCNSIEPIYSEWIHCIATNIFWIIAIHWIHCKQYILECNTMNSIYSEMNSLVAIQWYSDFRISLYCNTMIFFHEYHCIATNIFNEFIVSEYIGCNTMIFISWISLYCNTMIFVSWIYCIATIYSEMNSLFQPIYSEMQYIHFRIYWLQYNEYSEWIIVLQYNEFISEYIGCNTMNSFQQYILKCNTMNCNQYIQNEFIVLQPIYSMNSLHCNQYILSWIHCCNTMNYFRMNSLYCNTMIFIWISLVLQPIYSEFIVLQAIYWLQYNEFIVFNQYIGCNTMNSLYCNQYILKWIQWIATKYTEMNSLYCNQYIL